MGDFRSEVESAVNRYREITLDLEYNQPGISDKKYIEKVKNRDKDIKHKTTTFGPHRDSVLVTLNNKDRSFGSPRTQNSSCYIKITEVLLSKTNR